MRWPFDQRATPTQAWGIVAVGTAGLVGIPGVLATLHANEPHFRWAWPSNWMIVPLLIFLAGLALLVVPVRRHALPSAEALKVGPIPRPPGPFSLLIMQGKAMQATLGPPGNWNLVTRPHDEFNQRFADWSARAQEALKPWPGCYEQFASRPVQDPYRVFLGPMAFAYDRIDQGVRVLQEINDREKLGG